jgi:glycosyltransferase involved in cell wall biosynthesis
MSRAQILLSTYNGARYLEALLDSVARQNHGGFSILVRDDGSTDETTTILNRYAGRGLLRTLPASHVGAAASFIDLLVHADADADHVAFCDQDDVWFPDKLARATDWLDRQPSETPVLYCGRTMVVDEDLRPLSQSALPRHPPCFENALVENIAAGCTMAMNRAARRLLVATPAAPALAHDWWAYLVVAAFGLVLYDAEARVLYRQHGANAVGAQTGFARRWSRRVKFFRQNRRELPMVWRALEFQRLFERELEPGKARVLARFLDRRRSWGASIAYAARPDVFRQGRFDNVILRALLASKLA